jgi:hypothetical protein
MKIPLGRSKNICEDNEMDRKEIGRESEEWIQLAQDIVQWRILVNIVMYFQDP